MSSTRRWPKRTAIVVLVLLALDQALLHAALADGWLQGRRVAPFDPPVFNTGQEARLERIRERLAAGKLGGSIHDPDLGWCPRPGPEGSMYEYDWSGARLHREPTLEVKDAARTRIAVMGCSFARCDEVSAADSWVGRLADALPSREFVNLGAGGFGIDPRADVARVGVLPVGGRPGVALRPGLIRDTDLNSTPLEAYRCVPTPKVACFP